MGRSCLVAGLGVLAAAASADPQLTVPRVEYRNPIEGFSIEVPEDWEMAAGGAGNVEIAIDAPVGAKIESQPALWFFYATHPPEQEARELAKALQLLGRGGAPTVRATGRPDEWEVTYTSTGTRGAITERWLCRKEGRMSYVIGAMARPGVAPQLQQDIDRALRSCHLIETPILHYFRDPHENAYRLTLPHGWTWEGQIFRSQAVPGYFVWKVQRPDGLMGAFSSPPGVFNIAYPYTPAGQLAGGLILDALRREAADMRLERVHPLPRASAYFTASITGAGIGANPRVDKVRADYVGAKNGTRVRCRVSIATFMVDASPLLGGRGNWFMVATGGWAPADQFDELYPVARGVVASVWTSPDWRKRQFDVVNDVLSLRRQVMWHYAAEWASLIGSKERVLNPDTGEYEEVPNRDGGVWKDADGKLQRVPHNEEKEQELRDKRWERVQ